MKTARWVRAGCKKKPKAKMASGTLPSPVNAVESPLLKAVVDQRFPLNVR
jgi:hypothetical protein